MEQKYKLNVLTETVFNDWDTLTENQPADLVAILSSCFFPALRTY